MSCPDEPDNTCPLIDDVIGDVKKCENAFDTLNDIDFRDVLKTMEEIRNANSDLRGRAQFFEQQAGESQEAADKLVAERDMALARVAELEAELAGLVSQAVA